MRRYPPEEQARRDHDYDAADRLRRLSRGERCAYAHCALPGAHPVEVYFPLGEEDVEVELKLCPEHYQAVKGNLRDYPGVSFRE